MKKMLLATTTLGVCAAALLGMPPAANAAGFRSEGLFDLGDKDRWIVRARAIGVLPDEGAAVSLIGGDVDIDDQVVPELDFTYFFTRHVAAELILATTPHDVTAINTSLGNVDLGDVWLLPPTLTLQYHFTPDSKTFRPYVGAGVNYTHFYNADPGAMDRIDYDSSFGYALQAGFDYGLSDNWAVNFDVKKVMINTDATLYTGGTTIAADVDIDPWVVGVGVAYRF